MIPIIMLIFVIALMILFVIFAYLQKGQDTSEDFVNILGEELETIKKKMDDNHKVQ